MNSSLRNEKGAALITALMLTLISLAIIMLLLYYVTTGLQMSASQKRYKTVLEAAYGGTSFSVNEFIPKLNSAIFGNYTSGVKELLTSYASNSNLSLTLGNLSCLQQKLDNSTNNWGSGCSKTLDPRDHPDMTFVLKSTLDTSKFIQPTGYKVYTKIVGTPIKGNTDKADMPNLRKGENVVESADIEGGGLTIPTTYRIEVRAERETNPQEKANISVLYAY
ncbi:MAG: pilus assembly protein PilX [Deltaproteobacteria bacterium]|nr:pilus assembly protein PilX [Deltaproteobacteria bacterium]TLN02939.1 MAG: pilus assembly protein PilX [bacterium]